MIANLKNVFKVADLRNKILFTLAMLALYRFGVAIRVPGIDADAVKQFEEGVKSQGALGFLNLFSGGAFGSFSIFALGIMPYITASIIMQVLGVVIPKLEKLQQEGASGQRKITQYTRYLGDRHRPAPGDGPHVHLRPGPRQRVLRRRAVGAERPPAAGRDVAARLPRDPRRSSPAPPC